MTLDIVDKPERICVVDEKEIQFFFLCETKMSLNVKLKISFIFFCFQIYNVKQILIVFYTFMS